MMMIWEGVVLSHYCSRIPNPGMDLLCVSVSDYRTSVIFVSLWLFSMMVFEPWSIWEFSTM